MPRVVQPSVPHSGELEQPFPLVVIRRLVGRLAGRRGKYPAPIALKLGGGFALGTLFLPVLPE